MRYNVGMEKKIALVYQAGIANVFEVSAFLTHPIGRETKRIHQASFGDCGTFVKGLLYAGYAVRTYACNQAGDITDSIWSTNLDEQPFSDKFTQITAKGKSLVTSSPEAITEQATKIALRFHLAGIDDGTEEGLCPAKMILRALQVLCTVNEKCEYDEEQETEYLEGTPQCLKDNMSIWDRFDDMLYGDLLESIESLRDDIINSMTGDESYPTDPISRMLEMPIEG